MAYVRRNWFSSVLYISIIALGLAVWLTPLLFSENTPESAQAQATEPKPIDPYLYTRVQSLRQELALTNNDLAAMGCTQESATVLLKSLKTWCETNKAVIDQQHRDEIQAKAALRDTIRQINVGTTNTRVADSLPNFQQDLAKLYEQRKSMIDGFTAQLESRMDAYQLKTWQNARSNGGLPERYRYVPDVNDTQRRSVHGRLKSRSSADSVSAVIDNELTWNQKQAIEAGRINQATKASAVRAAEAGSLPMPSILAQP